MRGVVAILQRKGGFLGVGGFYWGFLRGAREKNGGGKIDKAAGESLLELAREGGICLDGRVGAEGGREGPQGRPPQAAVGGRPQAAPQARAKPGLPCGPCAAACRGQQKAAPEGGPCFGILFS